MWETRNHVYTAPSYPAIFPPTSPDLRLSVTLSKPVSQLGCNEITTLCVDCKRQRCVFRIGWENHDDWCISHDILIFGYIAAQKKTYGKHLAHVGIIHLDGQDGLRMAGRPFLVNQWPIILNYNRSFFIGNRYFLEPSTSKHCHWDVYCRNAFNCPSVEPQAAPHVRRTPQRHQPAAGRREEPCVIELASQVTCISISSLSTSHSELVSALSFLMIVFVVLITSHGPASQPIVLSCASQ